MSERGVLILSPFFTPNIGGVETHLNDLCDLLARGGNRVFVFTYKPLTRKVKAPSFEKRGNLEIHRMSWPSHDLFNRLESSFLLEFFYLTPALLLFSMLHLLRARNRIDVIHSHGLNAAFVGIFLSKIFQKRCVVSIHAIYNLSRQPMLARLMRIVLSNCDVVLTMAKRSKCELVEAGVDERKVKVFTYWVDQGNFRPLNKNECKISMGLANKFVVLFVGRLLQIKGVTVFLETARKLSYDRDTVFLVAGDGPCRELVKSASARTTNIRYEGPMANRKLLSYYNAADLIVVPSLYEEGYARVILEGLSCGTPVVASNRGCIPEELDSSVGLLMDPTPENLKQAISRLHNNAGELNMMRLNCRSYAELNFSQDNAHVVTNAYT